MNNFSIDPIVTKIHEHRQAFSTLHNNDLKEIFQAIMAMEKDSDSEYIQPQSSLQSKDLAAQESHS